MKFPTAFALSILVGLAVLPGCGKRKSTSTEPVEQAFWQHIEQDDMNLEGNTVTTAQLDDDATQETQMREIAKF